MQPQAKPRTDWEDRNQPPIQDPAPGLPWRLLRRGATYLAAGALLFAAFSSPFHFLPGIYLSLSSAESPWWERLTILMGSSLLAGLAIDGLVRERSHWGITALAHLVVLSILATYFSGLVEVMQRSWYPSLAEMLGLIYWSVILGPAGALLSFHLAFPISLLLAVEADRTLAE